MRVRTEGIPSPSRPAAPSAKDTGIDWEAFTLPQNTRLCIISYRIQGTTQTRGRSDEEVFTMLHELSLLVQQSIQTGGGLLLKIQGNRGIVLFSEKQTAAALQLMTEVQTKAAGLLSRYGDYRVCLCCHTDTLCLGPLGPRGYLDAVGRGLNILLQLEDEYPRHALVISEKAFRKMGPEIRSGFKKHSPPAVYLYAAPEKKR